jgi:transcriptional regulator with XRE-family HTH domain
VSPRERKLTGEELKAWRIALGYTQEEAANQLGFTRATIQNWERSITRVPVSVELASRQIRRRSKLRLDFGPVILIYSRGPLWLAQDSEDPLTFCRKCADARTALELINELKGGSEVFNLMLVDETNRVIWSGGDLL